MKKLECSQIRRQVQNNAAAVEDSLVIPQRSKHGITTQQLSNSISSYIFPQEWKTGTQDEYLYTTVHFNIVYNSQK